MLRYDRGVGYAPHYDCRNNPANRRMWSVIVYLTGGGDSSAACAAEPPVGGGGAGGEGGDTVFTKLGGAGGLRVSPKKGMALVWRNLALHGEGDGDGNTQRRPRQRRW